MFSCLSKLDLFSVYLDWINMFQIIYCILQVLLIVDLQLGLVRAELHLILGAGDGCQVEKEVQLVDVVGDKCCIIRLAYSRDS